MSDNNFEKEKQEKTISRRKFLKTGVLAGGAAVIGLGLGIPSVLKTDNPKSTREVAQVPLAYASINSPYVQIPLPGKNVTKYAKDMHHFLNADRVTGSPISVGMYEIQQKVLPASFYTALATPYNAGTYVWGYKVGAQPAHYPGFTIQATRGTTTEVDYTNNLPPTGSTVQKFVTIDQTVNWAAPTGQQGLTTAYSGPPPTVPHLHGGEVPSGVDGGPTAWFTPGASASGPGYNQAPAVGSNYPYPNTQEPATLWFHDHCLGATRTNVYSGLAAFYLLRDATYDTGLPGNGANLPADLYEAEIVIQDRQFDTNGQLLFPDGYPAGLNGPPPNPTVHPYWIPEFFGDVIVVNGDSWPFLQVEPRRYRFRLLDGSNARFYSLSITDKKTGVKLPIYQIGTDGGLLDKPVAIIQPNELLIAPGERADIIVDFTAMAGKTFTMYNSAKAPYPAGASPDPQTVAQIMQFRVTATLIGTDTSFDPAAAGATLRGPGKLPLIDRLVDPVKGTLAPGVTPTVTRQLTLKEVTGPGGPLEVLVNNAKFAAAPTETPTNGTTELWEIINITADAHPIHLHLVQFQVMNRQAFQTNKYVKAYNAAFPGGVGDDGITYPAGVFIPGFGPPLPYSTPNADGALGGNPAVTPYLQDGIIPPKPNEAGWKDTVQMYPGQVTRIVVRFANQTGGSFAFNPALGPGYVWHCHIVDHEDNEMMRPYHL